MAGPAVSLLVASLFHCVKGQETGYRTCQSSASQTRRNLNQISRSVEGGMEGMEAFCLGVSRTNSGSTCCSLHRHKPTVCDITSPPQPSHEDRFSKKGSVTRIHDYPVRSCTEYTNNSVSVRQPHLPFL